MTKLGLAFVVACSTSPTIATGQVHGADFSLPAVGSSAADQTVGTPFFYRTTQDFLVRFGLNELTELPKPEDLDADLAATVDAREIAAPTAAATGIHVETAEEEPEAAEGGEDAGDDGPPHEE